MAVLYEIFHRKVCGENNPVAAMNCRSEIKCRYRFFLTEKYIKSVFAKTTVLITIRLMPQSASLIESLI
jgi:ribosomal protein L40E